MLLIHKNTLSSPKHYKNCHRLAEITFRRNRQPNRSQLPAGPPSVFPAFANEQEVLRAASLLYSLRRWRLAREATLGFGKNHQSRGGSPPLARPSGDSDRTSRWPPPHCHGWPRAGGGGRWRTGSESVRAAPRGGRRQRRPARR
jgi:hypothetical protein